MSINGMKQLQGEKRAEFIARCQAAQAAAAETVSRGRAGMKPRRRTKSDRPAYGSQQWAETRGDDLGESHDHETHMRRAEVWAPVRRLPAL